VSPLVRPHLGPTTERPRRRALRLLCAGAAAAAMLLTTATAPAFAAWSDGPSSVTEGAPGDEVEIGYRLTGDTAVDRAGNAWYAWVQTDDQTATTSASATYTVRASYRPVGGAWQQPVTLRTLTREAGSSFPNVSDVAVGLDAAGQPTVAWPVRTSTAVSVQTASRAGGGTWSPAQDVAAGASLSGATGVVDYSISLDVAEDGTAALAWQADEGTFVARRSAGSWGAAALVGTAGEVPGAPDTVGLGQDQQGRITAVWRTYDDTTGGWGVAARSSTLTGSWTAEAVTLAQDVGVVSRPSQAVDLSGAAVATWGTDDGVRAAVRRAGADAATWEPSTTLSSGAANAAPATAAHLTAGQGIPAVAFDEHGTATVVWPEKSPVARVAARSVTQAGEWGTTQTVAEGTTTNAPSHPIVVPGRDGALTVAWNASPSLSIVGGVVSLGGGQVQVANRPSPDGGWSTPTSYVTPGNGTYGTVSALGWNNLAALAVTGDALGNVIVGWAPYKSAVVPLGDVPNQTVDWTVTPEPALDWTARGVTGSSNLRSWLGYLSTDWASGGAACPKGVHGTVVSGGATRPAASDPESWRFAQTDAYVDAATGKTIVQYSGTLSWVLDAHCIDIAFTNPRLEIAADGASARIYSDGTASGSMADAISGNPTTAPVTNVRLLELDLSGSAARVSADGTVKSWTRVPARLAAAAASAFSLTQYAQGDFGRLTFSVPTDLPTRSGSTGDSAITLATPTVAGSPVVATTLTAAATADVVGATLAYQWLSDGAAIPGATARTFTVTPAQLGHRLSVRVTATKDGFTGATATSAPTAQAASRGTVKVSGKAATGGTLTALTAGWTPGARLAYQWKAGGKTVSKATKKTLKVTKTLRGKKITVTVTATKAGHPTLTATSATTKRTILTATPKISGKAKVGATLRAKPGAWTSKARLTYRWYANGKAVRKATKKTLKVTKTLRGKKITVRVTGAKAGYPTVTKASKATKKVAKR